MTNEYTVCRGETQTDLKKVVNQEIKNGWEPLGGVAVSILWGPPGPEAIQQAVFFQAMVKTTRL